MVGGQGIRLQRLEVMAGQPPKTAKPPKGGFVFDLALLLPKPFSCEAGEGLG
jgi:hypothetical protein